MKNFLKTLLIAILVTLSLTLGSVMNKKTPEAPVVLGNMSTTLPIYLPTNASTTVLTSSTVVLATSTSRKYAIIVNDSANVVYLGIGAPAVIGKGIRLSASGGTYEINDLNPLQGPVYGVSSANSNVTTLEE